MKPMLREAALASSLAVLTLASWYLPDRTGTLAAAAAATEGPAAPPDTEGRAAAPATGAVARAVAPEADRSRLLELPDGTSVPTLNGAVDAAPVGHFWGPSPWSPIVGVERSSAGLDWYRHEDGSYSTTQMVWRSDLGREVAMTRVAHPGPTPAPSAR